MAAAARTFRRIVKLDVDANGRPGECRRRFPELADLIDHHDRATRAEFLENVCLIVEACLARADLGSGRVGHKRRWRTRSGRVLDFVGLYRATIAKWASVAESTASHILTTLRRAGVLHGPGLSIERGGDGVNRIPQPVESCDRTAKTPAGVRGLPCVRRFPEEFWVALDLQGYRFNLMHKAKAADAGTVPRAVASALASRNIVAAGGLVAGLASALALERPPPSG